MVVVLKYERGSYGVERIWLLGDYRGRVRFRGGSLRG